MVKPPPLVVIVGPTGVGKTAVAVHLAKLLPIEAINADSRQVYRGLDVGTGKPTREEQAALRHHVIDVVDPHERYHAARFRADALRAIEAIRARGHLPVVVGGTGLYVRALLKGLRPAPPADAELRRALETAADDRGVSALHERLAALDPAAAERLHPNDRVRIVRALEIRLLAARVAEPASSAMAADRRPDARSPEPSGHADWQRAVDGWHLLMVGLRQERSTLNRRLAERARAMVAHGMMEEVRRLLAAGGDDTLPAMDGIGYRQLCAVARGHLAVEDATRLMIRDTTRYAKRQMTWFARDAEVEWIDVDAAGGVAATAERIAKRAVEEGLIE